MINRLRFAWAITPCRMAEYCILLPAAALELQQNGLQETRQVVKQLGVQVPNTAGGTPEINEKQNNNCQANHARTFYILS